MKPLGMKAYGSIPHLPGSRMGPADRSCHEGHLKIATEKKRDRHDTIIVQEKLDGSNVCVAKIDGVLLPLTRAGYHANTSKYVQHHYFDEWVNEHYKRFDEVLQNGERMCGEWLAQAHGTIYNLRNEPFFAFDIINGKTRMPYMEFVSRVGSNFIRPEVLSYGEPFSIENAMKKLDTYGYHGAADPVEGAVWRVERNVLKNPGVSGERVLKVDFLAKYVRPDKIDGKYLPEISGGKPVWNWQPNYT